MQLTKRLRLFLFLSLGIGAAAPVLLQLRNPRFFSSFQKLSFWNLVIPFIAYFIVYAIDALRLKIILKPFDIHLPLTTRLENGILGSFYSNITPMAAGGQPFQIYHLSKAGVPHSIAGAVILVRYTEFLLTSIMMTFIGAMIYAHKILRLSDNILGGDRILFIGLGLYLLLTLLLLAIFLAPQKMEALLLKFPKFPKTPKISKKIKSTIHDFCEAIIFLRKKASWQLTADFLLGLMDLVLQAFSLWFVLRIISSDIENFPTTLISFVLLNSIAYFVPTPGGSGGVEGLYTLFFSTFSTFSAVDVGAVVVVWRMGSYYLHIGFQILILIFGKSSKNI